MGLAVAMVLTEDPSSFSSIFFKPTVIHVLDPNINREYVLAVESVPDLAKKETPFAAFLRTDDYNTMNASKRLAIYWKRRKQVFQERLFLPMTQTGLDWRHLKGKAFRGVADQLPLEVL